MHNLIIETTSTELVGGKTYNTVLCSEFRDLESIDDIIACLNHEFDKPPRRFESEKDIPREILKYISDDYLDEFINENNFRFDTLTQIEKEIREMNKLSGFETRYDDSTIVKIV